MEAMPIQMGRMNGNNILKMGNDTLNGLVLLPISDMQLLRKLQIVMIEVSVP